MPDHTGAVSSSSTGPIPPFEEFELKSKQGDKRASNESTRRRAESPVPLASRPASAAGDTRETRTPRPLQANLPANADHTAHSELPVAVLTRQREAEQAQRAYDSDPSEARLEARDEAMMAYLTEVTTHLRQLSKAPASAANPSARQYLGNVAGALMNNLASFFLPTLASVYVPERYQALVYALGLAVMAAPAAEAASFTQRIAGGATAQLRIAGRDSANVGTYKSIAGDLLVAMSNLALYGLVSGTLSVRSTIADSPGGQIGRSLVAGSIMSLVGQAAITGGAKFTLMRNGVEDAKNLPETAHNRTLPNGIYLQKDSPRADRTTWAIKAQEITSRVIGGVFGAGLYGLIRESAHKSVDGEAKQNVAAVLGGVAAYLLIAHAVRGLFTFIMGDPAKHANRFGIAASDVLSRQIRAAAVNEFDNLLDTVGMDIHEGLTAADAPHAKRDFDDAFGVLSGAALRGKAEHNPDGLAQADRMIAGLRTAAATLQGSKPELSGTESRLITKLNAAAASIETAKNNYARNAPIQPELQDIGNRIRDVEALMLEAMYRANPSDGRPTPNGDIMAMATTLMPTFAALRELDRRGNAHRFIHDVREFTLGKKSAIDVVKSLVPDGHQRVLARDVAAIMNTPVNSEDKTRLLEGIQDILQRTFRDQVPGIAQTKVLMLRNQLSDAPAGERRTPQEFLQRLATTHDPQQLQAIGRDMTEAFAHGHFTPADFLGAVDDLRARASDAVPVAGTAPAAGTAVDAATIDIEADPGVRERVTLERLEAALPQQFEATVRREFPVESGKSLAKAADDMLTALERDQAQMPEVHRGLMASALSLPNDANLADLAFPEQNDAHFHPTSYSGRINSLSHLVEYMKRNNIRITNLAGIPSQVYNPTAERKYYANSEHDIDYRDHDFPLAVQYGHLPDEQKDRFDLSITGFDVTNGPNIMQELKNRLRAHPRVFKAVGEVTLKKEIISAKNPHNPQIDSDATQALFDACANAGLPLILHCDRSDAGKKDLYAQQVFDAIAQWAGRTQWRSSDVMALDGADAPPPMVPKIVWAHGAGISRFTAESNTHTRQLDSLLNDPRLNVNGQPVLSLDLSWDFIGHDILENLYDQLTRRNVSPPIREGIQNLLRAYKSFTELGNRSDKSDDLNRKTLAAFDRVGAEEIAEIYFEALANFKSVVSTEMKKADVRQAFMEMTGEHGEDGNNWLYIFRQHQDRLLFGTDALAVGIKAHGDAAYAMNTQVLTPMYHIFDALGEYDPGSRDVSRKVATDNYLGVFRDPAVAERREAFEAMLASEAPAEHSTNVAPQAFVSQGGVRRRVAAGADASVEA